MPTITVSDRSGVETTIDAKAGSSMLEVIREAGIDGVLAICGGCCSCATCHIFVDAKWFDQVGQPGEVEVELLDSSLHRAANSRLACQVRMTEELNGLQVTIAPED